ncbi:hypothetical protein LZ31DRAFT_35706 [Colletotrichum somersetense]|nr:hypothetical protein LZ31DRAFT_35706 [Colletotrichum somersetense]
MSGGPKTSRAVLLFPACPRALARLRLSISGRKHATVLSASRHRGIERIQSNPRKEVMLTSVCPRLTARELRASYDNNRSLLLTPREREPGNTNSACSKSDQHVCVGTTLLSLR